MPRPNLPFFPKLVFYKHYSEYVFGSHQNGGFQKGTKFVPNNFIKRRVLSVLLLTLSREDKATQPLRSKMDQQFFLRADKYYLEILKLKPVPNPLCTMLYVLYHGCQGLLVQESLEMVCYILTACFYSLDGCNTLLVQ